VRRATQTGRAAARQVERTVHEGDQAATSRRRWETAAVRREELARQLYRVAYRRGRFVLRSGQVSDHYFDKYRFESDPALLAAVATHVAPLVGDQVEVLAGLEMGGIPIATALALAIGLPAAFVRKKAKQYGTRQLAEGVDVAGRHLLIIEDVVSSGGQIAKSAAALRAAGGHVESALCVIDRTGGDRTRLDAAQLRLVSLFVEADVMP
jgi:orotate phosphoribosyltransferase